MKIAFLLFLSISAYAGPSNPPEPSKINPKAAVSDDDLWATDEIEIQDDVSTIKQLKSDNKEASTEVQAANNKKITEKVLDIHALGDRHPANPQAQSEVTRGFLDLDKPKDAIPHAEQFLALARASGDSKQTADALKLRANVNFSLRNYSNSAKDAQEVLKSNPADLEAQKIYALSANRSNAGNSAASTNAVTGPSSSRNLVSAAASNTAQTRSASPVLGSIQNAAAAQQSTLHQNEALHYLKLGDRQAALKALSLGLSKFPKNSQLLTLRSHTNLIMGNANASLLDAEAALLSDSKNPAAYIARAKARLALGGSKDLALADYQHASELDASFTIEYEAALARSQSAANPDAQVDANGIGMAGRRGLGFNPAAAREELFGSLPEPLRRLAPIAIILAIVCLILAIAAWLKRQEQP